MSENEEDNIRLAIVGSGNVATHLAAAFRALLVGIWSRDAGHARRLADSVGVGGHSDFGLLAVLKPDVIIVSVADKAIAEVAVAIGRLDYSPLVLHTSGTVGMEALGTVSGRTGIIYPLQTFTAGVPVDMRRVPFFTEAAREADLAVIDRLAATVSQSVHHADAAHRRLLHIAGVFTSNFSNVLLECVQRVLAEGGYPLDVVRPLLDATVAKAFEVGPHAAQTGPARRGDFAVIGRQEASLPSDLKPVYHVLTELILNFQGINKDIEQ